jgi:hypothetical protein
MNHGREDNNDDNQDPSTPIPIVTDDQVLLSYGIVRVPMPSDWDAPRWAHELTRVTPEILTSEGDGQYAFYRNILEEPDFPFDTILTALQDALQRYFRVQSLDEIRLDDAFCIHYNTSQQDSSGAKHTDPSDITLNICLEKSPDTRGSQVLFYGTQALEGVVEHIPPANFRFLVEQVAGTATLHWGCHPHETMALQAGQRTNIVMTYCYKDPSRSDVSKRTCYFS